MMPEQFTKISALAVKLIASSNSIEFLDEIEELNKEETAILDSMAFECTVCNQWYDQIDRSEKHDEWICQECE